MKTRKESLWFVLSKFRAFVILLPRAPLLRFAVIGLVLFVFYTGARWHHAADRADSFRPDADILYRAAVTLGIDSEAAVVRQRLVQLGQFLELDESAVGQSLEQEARALGLVETDPVIRRHIEHLAELALQRGGAAVLPSEAEVARYYATEAEHFLEPARVRLAQVYFSFERRGAATAMTAQATLERLRAQHLSPVDVGALGDPFARALGADAATRADLERAFGAELASAIDTAPVGTWTGPLRSAYGVHLIWVQERSAARPRPLAAVRNQIVHRLAHERGERLAARRLELLRQTAARQTP